MFGGSSTLAIVVKLLVHHFLYIAAFVSAGLSELEHLLDGVVRGVTDDIVGAAAEVGGIEVAHEVEQVGHLPKGGRVA